MTGPLRIAFIGQRGVPATYGGIEQHVEQIGSRLAARGHRVTVFCRANYTDGRTRWHRGMRLITLPVWANKHAEALGHSALSATWTLGRVPFDIIHYHALGPGLVSPISRFGSSAKVVQTVHGLDNQRAKWGGWAQRLLTLGEYASAYVPDRTVVVADYLKEYYADTHGAHVHAIPNGVVATESTPRGEVHERLGIDDDRYVLFVGRLVPEKAPDVLIRAFRDIDSDAKLVIAGDTSFTDTYVAELRQLADDDPMIIFAGFVYGEELSSLYANASLFVLPSRLEGLPLTLLEAASYGIPVIASNIPPHVEVLGTSQPGRRLVPTDRAAMARALAEELSTPTASAGGAAALRTEVLDRYDWDRVTDKTEALYRQLLDHDAERPTVDVDVTGRTGRG